MPIISKDRLLQVCFIVFAGIFASVIFSYSDLFDKDITFTRNALGMVFEMLGLIFVAIASRTKIHLKAEAIKEFEGEKSQIISAITHPKAWETGLILIGIGVWVQFVALGWNELESLSP